MVLLFTDNLVVFDHVRHRLIVIANLRAEGDLRAAYADAVARIDQIVADLRKPLTPPQARDCRTGTPGKATSPSPSYEEKVRPPRNTSQPATSSRWC